MKVARMLTAKEANDIAIKNYLEKFADIKMQYIDEISRKVLEYIALGRFEVYVDLPAALQNQWTIVDSIINRLKSDGYKATRKNNQLYIDWSLKHGS